MITNVRLTLAINTLVVVLTVLFVTTKISVPEIAVILITVANTMKFPAKITISVLLTFVLAIKVAYIMISNAKTMMYVPSILAVKRKDANLHLPVVMIITNVLMILAILLLVV